MANLWNGVITTAVAGSTSAPRRFRRQGLDMPRAMLCQGTFVYGSGGTSGTFWVQTSLDGGLTWADVFAFGVTTASLRQIMNIVAGTPKLAPITLTDGALTVNTAIDALIGDLWRVKWTTVGTYAGNTQMSIDLGPGNLVPAANE